MPKIVFAIVSSWMLIQGLGVIKAYATVNEKQEAQAEALCKQYPSVCK